MKNKIYFLSSLDYKFLTIPRRCEIEQVLKYLFKREAILMKINIPIVMNNINFSEIVLVSRHKGIRFKDIDLCQFPISVYVCLLKDNKQKRPRKIKPKNLYNLGIGELYKSYEDAIKHNFS